MQQRQFRIGRLAFSVKVKKPWNNLPNMNMLKTHWAKVRLYVSFRLSAHLQSISIQPVPVDELDCSNCYSNIDGEPNTSKAKLRGAKQQRGKTETRWFSCPYTRAAKLLLTEMHTAYIVRETDSN